MNTHKLLNVYCDAASQLYHTLAFAIKIGEQVRKDQDFNTVQMFNQLASIVRELHDELPDSLQTEESIKACANLFWHIHNPDGDESDDNIRAYRDVLIVLFHHGHDTFQDMCAQRDKYGFEVS